VKLHRKTERLIARTERADSRWVLARTVIFLVGLGLTLVGISRQVSWTVPVFGFAVVTFAIVLVLHARLRRRRTRQRLFLRILEEEAARSRQEWQKIPEHPTEIGLTPPNYFLDLDLIGAGHSLFRLINSTFSQHGWLALVGLFRNQATSAEEILQRQKRVSALMSRTAFRRKLKLVARENAEGILATQELLELLRKPLDEAIILRDLLILASIHVSFLVALLFAVIGAKPSIPWAWISTALWMTHWGVYRSFESRIHGVFGLALTSEQVLSRFLPLMQMLERAVFREKVLMELLSRFHGEERPSRVLARFSRIVTGLSIRGNPLVHVAVNSVFPWDHFLSLKLERLRSSVVSSLPDWLEQLGALEACASLAEYSVLQGAKCMPEIIPLERKDAPAIEAVGLAHPLIPFERRVGNPVLLNQSSRCILITGSNMSGKSTYLRTVGLGWLLAQAGARVHADRLAVRPMALMTSLRVADSLEDQLSSFYAEVVRLKSIWERARAHSAVPLLYLIDEIFRGTNNQERLHGAQALVRGLIRTESFGMVATHDLELARLAEAESGIANAHFRESMTEDGKMAFSYELSPGICPTTNAIVLMRNAGLPV